MIYLWLIFVDQTIWSKHTPSTINKCLSAKERKYGAQYLIRGLDPLINTCLSVFLCHKIHFLRHLNSYFFAIIFSVTYCSYLSFGLTTSTRATLHILSTPKAVPWTKHCFFNFCLVNWYSFSAYQILDI